LAGSAKRSLLRDYGTELGAVAGKSTVHGASSVGGRLQWRAVTSTRPELWSSADAALAVPSTIARATLHYVAYPDGNPARIACVGRKWRFRRLLETIGGAELTDVARRRSLWTPSALGQLDADLIVTEIHAWAAPSFRRAGWLILPQTVRWRAPAAAVPPERPSKSLKSDLQAVAKRSYSVEICRDTEAWREFLCRMLIPHTHLRYGSSAAYPSRSLLRRYARRGELLFVVEDGVRLAGGCVFTSGTTLFFPLCGVRDANRELVHQGVFAALYYFIAERARMAGIQTLDFGRTRPFLGDGVARYKAKWGFAPERDVLSQLVAIRPDPDHEGLRKAFAAQPMLVDDGERLVQFPERQA
jgi:hypothetical protein